MYVRDRSCCRKQVLEFKKENDACNSFYPIFSTAVILEKKTFVVIPKRKKNSEHHLVVGIKDKSSWSTGSLPAIAKVQKSPITDKVNEC